MDTVNIKLLGIYYAIQRLLKDNVASPMAQDIKPIIAMDESDYGLLTLKAISHMRKAPKAKKMKVYFSSLFAKVERGEIKPERYLGFEFSADETIKQMQMHDSFMTLYDSFFKQLKQSPKVLSSIREVALTDIKQLGFNEGESWMFNQMLTEQKQRSPITLGLESLVDVVDVIYEATCTHHGPAFTDRVLSQAVKESIQLFPAFRADKFL